MWQKSSRRPATALLILLALASSAVLDTTAAAAADKQQQKKQRRCVAPVLKGGKPPLAFPARVQLPSFCGQYACSCCTAPAAAALARAAQPVQDDGDLSAGCKELLLVAACRACDPGVGTGVKRRMCASMCERLYSACRADFFAFHPSGLVEPCTEQLEGQLVCSQLSELAGSAGEYCRAAGFVPPGGAGDDDDDDSEPCFDGSPVAAEACPAGAPQEQAAASSSSSTQRKRSKQAGSSKAGLLSWLPWRLKLRRRHKRQLAAAADLLMGTLIAAAMAWAVVAVLQRVMKPSARPRLRSPGGPPPTNAREVLARAAEARRRAGFNSGGDP